MTPEEKITMPIRAFETNQKLAFEWDQDEVDFELNEITANKTRLTFRDNLRLLRNTALEIFPVGIFA